MREGASIVPEQNATRVGVSPDLDLMDYAEGGVVGVGRVAFPGEGLTPVSNSIQFLDVVARMDDSAMKKAGIHRGKRNYGRATVVAQVGNLPIPNVDHLIVADEAERAAVLEAKMLSAFKPLGIAYNNYRRGTGSTASVPQGGLPIHVTGMTSFFSPEKIAIGDVLCVRLDTGTKDKVGQKRMRHSSGRVAFVLAKYNPYESTTVMRLAIQSYVRMLKANEPSLRAMTHAPGAVSAAIKAGSSYPEDVEDSAKLTQAAIGLALGLVEAFMSAGRMTYNPVASGTPSDANRKQFRADITGMLGLSRGKAAEFNPKLLNDVLVQMWAPNSITDPHLSPPEYNAVRNSAPQQLINGTKDFARRHDHVVGVCTGHHGMVPDDLGVEMEHYSGILDFSRPHH